MAIEPISHLGGVPRVAFAYDYQGRRVAKRVYNWDEGDPNDPNDDDWASTPSTSRPFVWSGWLMLLELDVDPNDANDPSTRRAYTWGLDLAGQQGSVNSLDAAGGIGGLLAISDPNDPCDANDLFGDFAYTYDANGNVGQLIDWAHDPNDPNGAIVARYEYDPYGKLLLDLTDPNEVGPYGTENPIRFSTKYFDDETGWGNWPIRYYDPVTGRWTSRDPLGETASVNLSAFVANASPNRLDALGLLTTQGHEHITRAWYGTYVDKLLVIDLHWLLVQGREWFFQGRADFDNCGCGGESPGTISYKLFSGAERTVTASESSSTEIGGSIGGEVGGGLGDGRKGSISFGLSCAYTKASALGVSTTESEAVEIAASMSPTVPPRSCIVIYIWQEAEVTSLFISYHGHISTTVRPPAPTWFSPEPLTRNVKGGSLMVHERKWINSVKLQAVDGECAPEGTCKAPPPVKPPPTPEGSFPPLFP